jgi:hypothetical protein
MPVAIIIALTALGGLAIWYWGAPSATFFATQELNRAKKEAENAGNTPPITLGQATQDSIVDRYITAYQTQSCGEIIEITEWIRERLTTLQSEGTAQFDAAQKKLCAELLSRNSKENQIELLGIRDVYLMPTTVTYKIVGADPGRQDLVLPVLERVWVAFEYPNRATAPRTPSGKAIEKLRAGLNISTENTVLKGSVIGNWEIDRESIRVYE